MGRKQPPGGDGSRPPTLLRQGNFGANGGDAAPGRLQREEPDVDAFSEQAASRQPTMNAALRKMDTLLKLNSALREEINLLASALAKADHSAFFDESTGLPNGRLLQNHFDLAKSRADRKHSQVGLICLSLYGLKFDGLIDNFAIDGVLQQAADRLMSSTRSYDSSCRYGHDGFVILLPHLEDREQAIAAQRRITARLTAAYKVEGTAVSVEARSGVAMYPLDGRNYAETLKVADSDKRSCGGPDTSLARQGTASASHRPEWT